MRDLEYKVKCYRLSDKVILDLAKLKANSGLSYNLLLKQAISYLKRKYN